jgi:hypothetical protein
MAFSIQTLSDVRCRRHWEAVSLRLTRRMGAGCMPGVGVVWRERTPAEAED